MIRREDLHPDADGNCINGIWIHPRAVVSPSTRIGQNVKIEALVVTEYEVTLCDRAQIGCSTRVEIKATVGEGSVIQPRCYLRYGSVVEADTLLVRQTVLGQYVVFGSKDQILNIGPLGERRDTLCVVKRNGALIFSTGCFTDNEERFRNIIAHRVRQGDWPHEKEYLDAIEYAKRRLL